MLRNFLISSFRHFRRNSNYTLLNLFGLSAALAGVFVIFTFLQSELGIDTSLENRESTYLVTLEVKSPEDIRKVGLTTSKIEKWIAETNSEVTSTFTVRSLGTFLLRNEEKTLERHLTLARENYFNYFNFDLKYGDPFHALSQPNSIILSEEAARLLYGDANPVGKRLEIFGDFSMPLQVTGVIESNNRTHVKFDCLISWDSKPADSGSSIGDWYKNSIYTYIKTGIPYDSKKLSHLLTSRYLADFPQENLNLVPYNLGEVYFASNNIEFMSGFRSGNRQSLMIMSLIAILILVIAVVNYVNINISLVLKRIREVGVRKVMGASKRMLSMQFLCESFLMAMASGILALTLADLFILNMPDLFSDAMLRPFESPVNLVGLSLLTLFVGLLSGIYPSVFINKIPITDGIRNQLSKGTSKTSVRNVLLGLQFIITTGLLIMSVVVYQQQQFVTSKNLGFNKEEILLLPINSSSRISAKYRTFKEQLAQIPEVKAVSVSTDVLGSGYTNNSYYVATEGMTDIQNNGVMATYFGVDTDFVPTYELELVQGRNFSGSLTSDSAGVIINETLATKLGFADPLGQRIRLFGEESPLMTILGVVGDYNFQSLHMKISPAVLYLTNQNVWNASIRFDRQNTDQLLRQVEHTWRALDQEVPFTYTFLDEDLSRFYKKDQELSQIIAGFSLLSVLLSIVGIIGITAFSIEQKLKEISIRKVLGANVMQLVYLFNKQILVIFLATMFICLPASFMLIDRWLNTFAYHIPNHWLFYLFAMVGTFTLILSTISLTALKAAKSNPAPHLRNGE